MVLRVDVGLGVALAPRGCAAVPLAWTDMPEGRMSCEAFACMRVMIVRACGL